MTLAYPLSGRDVGGHIPWQGRAAVPVPAGAGFNWRSMARHAVGRIVPGAGLRGLGQDCTDDPALCGGTSTTTLNLPGITTLPTQTTPTTTPTSSSSSSAPWYAPLIAAGLAVGGQITNYELNPLLQKQTYVTTPQGLVYASNTATTGIPGLTTTNMSSMLPLLLIGGLGLVLVMGMAKR